MVGNKGQMKIQQMAIFIVAIFFFFMLVGLFFIKIQLSSLGNSADSYARDAAISSIEVISDMPEFNCDSTESMCIDEDKVRVISGNSSNIYRNFWPVSSIEVYKVSETFDEEISCPGANCNYFNVYDNGQINTQKFSSFVSLCKDIREGTRVYNQCEIAKLVVGVKIKDE